MQTIHLCSGKGEEGKSHCVMAATSIVAGESFTDQPHCVCPTITAALIRINDRCPDNEVRERLLGHLPWLIIGTRGDNKVMIKRAQLFAEYAKQAAADAARAAYAAYAAADAADAAWETEMKKFIDFIEEKIIPVHTTMPIEPGYRIEELICYES